MNLEPLKPEQLEEALRAYKEAGGNKAAAARLLGIPVETFKSRYRKALKRPRQAREIEEADGPKKHCVIPDCQVKDGVPLEHLRWAGQYIAEKRPDVIICIGDFADMASLSRYNSKLRAENLRYKKDVSAVHRGLELLMTPIVSEPGYNPRLEMVPGNHENMINRYVEENPIMQGTISPKDLGYEAWGWTVHEYLKPVKIDGISYCHYFYNPNTGKPYAGANLETRLKTIGMSFTMGHQQGLQVAIRDLADGTRQRGLVCGSFYQHYEDYKGPQGNGHWQGIIMKHEVENGNYDLLEVSLKYLKRRYS